MVSAQTSALIGQKPASLLQHEMLADVADGSLGDISGPPSHVRFTPSSRPQSGHAERPLSARSRHDSAFRSFAAYGEA